MSSFTRTVPATMWLRAIENAALPLGYRPAITLPAGRWPRAFTDLAMRINSARELPTTLQRWYAMFQCIAVAPVCLFEGGSVSLSVRPQYSRESNGVRAVTLSVQWPAEDGQTGEVEGRYELTLPVTQDRARADRVPVSNVIPAERAEFRFDFAYERWVAMGYGDTGRQLEDHSGCLAIRPTLGENYLDIEGLLDQPEMRGFSQFIVETAHLLEFQVHIQRDLPGRMYRGEAVAYSRELRVMNTGPVVFSATFEQNAYLQCIDDFDLSLAGHRLLMEINNRRVITCAEKPASRILVPLMTLSQDSAIENFRAALQSIAPGMGVLSESLNGGTVTVRLVDLEIQRTLGAGMQSARSRSSGSFSFTGEVRRRPTTGSITMAVGGLDSQNMSAFLGFGEPTFTLQPVIDPDRPPTVASKPAPIVTQSRRRISNPKRGNKDVPHDDDQRGGNQVHSRTLRRSRRTGE